MKVSASVQAAAILDGVEGPVAIIETDGELNGVGGVYVKDGHWSLLESSRSDTPLGQFVTSVVKGALAGAMATIGETGVKAAEVAVLGIEIAKVKAAVLDAIAATSEQLTDSIHTKLSAMIPGQAEKPPETTASPLVKKVASRYPIGKG
jgi:hypothetical protein